MTRSRLKTFSPRVPLLLCLLLALTTACGHYSMRFSDDDGEYAWSHGPRRVSVKVLGDVEFTESDRDVARLSPDGYLLIEELVAWDSKVLQFSPGPNGTVATKLLVNGDEHPMDAEARAWMGRLLPEVIRQTGFDAEKRVQRILAKGGMDALAAEIPQVHSGRVRARYVEEAFLRGSVGEEGQLRLLRQAPNWIGSDSRLAELLAALRPRAQSEPLRGAFFDAAGRIGSDSRKADLLRDILSQEGSDIVVVRRVLQLAQGIGSDSRKADLLADAVRYVGQDEAARQAFFAAARSVGSDSKKTQALQAMLDDSGNDPAVLTPLIETADTNRVRQ